MLIGQPIEPSPGNQPNQSQKSWNHERGTPAPAEINVENDKWCDRASHRATAIEQRSGQSAFALRKPFAYDFGRSWPVPRFARSQQEAKCRKTVEAACQRSQHRRYRVPSDCQSQTPPCADAVHQPAAHRLPDGVGQAESDDYVSVVGIGPVVLQLKIRGEKREGLAVYVVNDGRRKQEPADPPAQRRKGTG